jgi:hypothetical protein
MQKKLPLVIQSSSMFWRNHTKRRDRDACPRLFKVENRADSVDSSRKAFVAYRQEVLIRAKGISVIPWRACRRQTYGIRSFLNREGKD